MRRLLLLEFQEKLIKRFVDSLGKFSSDFCLEFRIGLAASSSPAWEEKALHTVLKSI